jgi:hypothetical protein
MFQRKISLSTEHHDSKVGSEEVSRKPDMIVHYNATKGVVITIDKIVN